MGIRYRWAPHPALPFSVGCKLILRAGAERDNRDTLLFAEFPSAQYLNRIWGIIAPHLDLTTDEIFSEVARVAASLPPAVCTDLISSAGDWIDVAGSVDDHTTGRSWVAGWTASHVEMHLMPCPARIQGSLQQKLYTTLVLTC